MKFRTILLFLLILSFNKNFAQESDFKDLEYTKIAEGTDSPIPDLQIVCFNKFFNKDYLPEKFQEKYNLTNRKLFKKKMLVEIFQSDINNEGIDKIEIVNLKESEDTILIEYNLVNENVQNDDKKLAPFIVLQIPKSKKNIKFIKDGVGLGQTKETYVE